MPTQKEMVAELQLALNEHHGTSFQGTGRYGPGTHKATMKVVLPAGAPMPVRKYANDNIPPLAHPFLRRLHLHEKHDYDALNRWFRSFGEYLGDPRKNPWCGEGVENAALEQFPGVPVPNNPFWARNWAKYGVDAGGPMIGSIGVIGWYGRGGHVGIVAAYDHANQRVLLLGCNQSNQIKFSWFPMKSKKGEFIAFRVPPSEKGKAYPEFGPKDANNGGTYAATR